MHLILANKRYSIYNIIISIVFFVMILWNYELRLIIIYFLFILPTIISFLLLPEGIAFELTEKELIVYKYYLKTRSLDVFKTFKITDITEWYMSYAGGRRNPGRSIVIIIDDKRYSFRQYEFYPNHKTKMNYPVNKLKKILMLIAADKYKKK